MLAMVAEPLEVSGHQIPLTLSIGVAFAASGDSGELLRNADAAMYLAKQRGRNRVELYDEGLRQVAADRISLIADLRHAVPRGELLVHYQPVVSLLGEDLHPRRGLLPPDKFISIAENAGLIGDIGSWVLKSACHQAALWARATATRGPLRMSVNVSARQLAKGSDLVSLVSEALQEASIDPATLVLEVTESVLMDDAEAALAILTELKGLGVQLAIDDFGTGYSSLVYLKRFPVDQLKIDRSFVRGLGTDADDSAIVASVVGLAHAVGIVAIAEGVETEQQLTALKRLGCSYGQGYLWSPARSVTALDALLRVGDFSTRAGARQPTVATPAT
jgi:EAL domain-containing protein (putative c-di-GMP-specific phosphodiesterase class I)